MRTSCLKLSTSLSQMSQEDKGEKTRIGVQLPVLFTLGNCTWETGRCQGDQGSIWWPYSGPCRAGVMEGCKLMPGIPGPRKGLLEAGGEVCLWGHHISGRRGVGSPSHPHLHWEVWFVSMVIEPQGSPGPVLGARTQTNVPESCAGAMGLITSPAGKTGAPLQT